MMKNIKNISEGILKGNRFVLVRTRLQEERKVIIILIEMKFFCASKRNGGHKLGSLDLKARKNYI